MKSGQFRVERITLAGADALLKFLPYFQNPRSRFGQPAGCENGCIGVSMLSRRAQRFYDACYRHHFVQPFDASSWGKTARLLIDDPASLAQADLETLAKLLTYHIRCDRFCDGHLLEMMESGHIGHILARLQAIRDSGDTGTPPACRENGQRRSGDTQCG